MLIALGMLLFPAGYAAELLWPTLPQLLVTCLIPFVISLGIVILVGVAEVCFALSSRSQSGGGPTAA